MKKKIFVWALSILFALPCMLHAEEVVNTETVVNGNSTGFNIDDLTPCPVSLWAIMNEDIESTQVLLSSVAETYFEEIDEYLENHMTGYAENDDFKNRVQLLVKANLIKYITQ